MVAGERRADDDPVRGRVIAVIGHALRTPVTTVRGLADVLHRTGAEPADAVAALRRETRVLEQVLDDLLVATDVATALPVQRPAEVAVVETVREVWWAVEDDRRDLRARAEARGLPTPDVGTPDGDGLVVDGDATVLCGPDAARWILRHVLDNAAKYGGRPVRPHPARRCGRAHRGGEPRPGLRRRRRGARLRAVLPRRGGGDGRTGARRRPHRRPAPRPARRRRGEPAAGRRRARRRCAVAGAVTAADRARIGVLIAEDEPDARLLLEIQLGLEDDLDVADRAEAVRFCREQPPDVVVMDLLMPRMNGLEAIAVLREQAPDVGIVAHTAVAGEVVRGLPVDHDVELVLKSGDVTDLVRAIRRVAAADETGGAETATGGT
jgi:two-component system, NarL family, nitrate/nitrite response regulator NarL